MASLLHEMEQWECWMSLYRAAFYDAGPAQVRRGLAKVIEARAKSQVLRDAGE